ncbi:MAG: hypothetical protein K8S99_15340 [Planctomycetes bacterium]|nr:hypothetical protein [Planctomycetota bacterium]
MQTTQTPGVKPTRTGHTMARRKRRDSGMILIMVIVVLLLLAIMGTMAMQIVRVDRIANHRFSLDNIDTVAAATIAKIQDVLVKDLFDEAGTMFNPAAPSGTANKGGGRSPYDYPWTNPGTTGNFLWPTAVGGLYDDPWLASNTPDFSTPTDPKWSHITNLYGIYVDLPKPTGTSSLADRVIDESGIETSDTNLSILNDLTGSSNPAQYMSRGADADGDGIPDSRWTYAPIRTIGGVSYYTAVRIIDNSAMANANVWTSQVDVNGNYDTTETGINAPRWSYPSELNLGNFVRLTDTTKSTRMTGLEKQLLYRFNHNPPSPDPANSVLYPADASVSVLPTPWYRGGVSGSLQAPWSRDKFFKSLDINIRTRGHYWLQGASRYGNYGSFLGDGTYWGWTATGTISSNYRYTSFAMDNEVALRRNNGLADDSVNMTMASSAQNNDFYVWLRQDKKEADYIETSANVGGPAAAGADAIKAFFTDNPRNQLTLISGSAIYAPRLPNITTSPVPTHNGVTLPNDPAIVLKTDLNALSYGRTSATTQAQRLLDRAAFLATPSKGSNSPYAGSTGIYRPSDGQAMLALSTEIRKVIERGTFYLPWNTSTAPNALARERFAHSLAMNIRNFYHEIDNESNSEKGITSMLLGGNQVYGWRPLPMITEIYTQRAYSISGSPAPVAYQDGAGNWHWQVQWTQQSPAPPPATAPTSANQNLIYGTGFVIEIRNPYSYPIDIRGLLVNMGSSGPPTLVSLLNQGPEASSWTTRTTTGTTLIGSGAGDNVMRPEDVIYLYLNAGTSGSANNNMLNRIKPPEAGMVHHVRNLATLSSTVGLSTPIPVTNYDKFQEGAPSSTPAANPTSLSPVSITMLAFDWNITDTTTTTAPRIYQEVQITPIDDRAAPMSSQYLASLDLMVPPPPSNDPLRNPPRSARLLEADFKDPGYPAPGPPTPPLGFERYKQRTFLGNGNGLNALTVAGSGATDAFVKRDNYVPVGQATYATPYVPPIPAVPRGSRNPLTTLPHSWTGDYASGSVQVGDYNLIRTFVPRGGRIAEQQRGQNTPLPAGHTWAEFPGAYAPAGSISPAKVKGQDNLATLQAYDPNHSATWGTVPNPVPPSFFGPSLPPSQLSPVPATDEPQSPATNIYPDPPAYIAPDPPADEVPDPPARIDPNPPADIPAVGAITAGAIVSNPEPPYPWADALMMLGRKDKTVAPLTTEVAVFTPAIDPYTTNMSGRWSRGVGGNAGSTLATQQLIFPTPYSIGAGPSYAATYVMPRHNRLGTVGQIAMVAALPFNGSGSNLLPETWASTSPKPTSVEQFMLDFRSPNFVGGANNGNLSVPHATFLIDRLTAVSPRYDGLDNDGDGVVDEEDELFVPGTLNINTASADMIKKALPIPTIPGGDSTVRDAVVDAIVNYRDMKGTYSAANRGVAAGFRTLNGQGLKGIAYVGELFAALDMMPAGPGNIGNNVDGSGNPKDDTDINGTVIDWWGPNANFRKSVKDNRANDRKERVMIPAMLTNVARTRSDIFTAYILLQGFPTGDFSVGPVESARLFVILDRSGCTTDLNTHGAKILAIYKY